MVRRCIFKKYRKLNLFVLYLIAVVVFLSVFILLIHFKFSFYKHINSDLILSKTDIISIKSFDKNFTAKVSKNQYKNYNWRIKIPKLNLDAPILDRTSKDVLRKSVGHFEGTGILNGNICLAAHNRGYKYNFFQNIKNLEYGDIITYTVFSKDINFKVISNKVIEETDISVLENSNDKDKLTLITCEENRKEYRRCVIAERIL